MDYRKVTTFVLLAIFLAGSAALSEPTNLLSAQTFSTENSLSLSQTDLSSLINALKGVTTYLSTQPRPISLPKSPSADYASLKAEILNELRSSVPGSRSTDGLADSVSRSLRNIQEGGTLSNTTISSGSANLSNLTSSLLTVGDNALVVDGNGFVGLGSDDALGRLYIDMTHYSYGEALTPATSPPASGIIPPNGGIVVAANTHGAPITGVSASNTAVGTGLYLRSVRARGTLDTPLAVQAGDILLDMATDAWDGDSRVGDIARILFVAEGTIADGRVPTGITFDTSTDANPSVTAERMRITSAGNIGIGATSPIGKVHANLATLAPTSALVPSGGSFVATNNSSAQFTGVGSSNTANIAGLSLRSVRSRGTVDTPLTVQTGDTLLSINTDAWDGTSRVGTMASIEFLAEGTIATGRVPTLIAFSTASNAAPSVLTERMRIDSSGNVGIGITNPQQKLTVAGSVAFQGLGTGAGSGSICYTATTGLLSTSTSGCTSSSLRFKDNVQTLSDSKGLDIVRQLRPVSYTYKPEMLIPGDQIGFIAEEVDPLIPEIVGKDASNTPSNIDYAKLTPVLVKAIQELDAKLNSTSTQTITDNSGLLDNLAFVGGTIVNNVAHFVELVVGHLRATLISTEGLEIKDSATGIWYCVQITNGEWNKREGTCSTPAEDVENGGAPAATTTPG